MAGLSAGVAYVDVQARLDNLEKEIKNRVGGAAEAASRTMSEKFSAVGGAMAGVGKKMTLGITTPLALLGKSAFDAASSLNEAESKARVVFGDWIDSVEKVAATSATTMGISKAAYFDATGTLGNLFKAMGLGNEPTTEMSKNIVALASDLASFNDASPEEALTALRSGLIGETEPLKRFGVNLNQARIEEEALRLGLIKEGDALDAAAKAQASYSLIMMDTTLQQGDFARTADGAANRQRQVRAQFQDTAATIGTKLLPIGQKLLTMIGKWLDRFKNLSPETQDMILKIAGIAAAIGPVLLVAGKLIQAFGMVGKAFSVLSKLMMANPWVLLIAAVIALVVIIVKNWDTIVNAIKKAWEWIGNIVSEGWKAMKNAFISGIQFVVNAFLSYVGTFINLAAKAFGWIPGIGPKLREAASEFNSFKDRVNASLENIKDKTITVQLRAQFDRSLAKARAANPRQADFSMLSGRAEARQHGGPVTAMRPYLVGEAGPEIIIPRRSGTVLPNGMGGGVTYYITVQGAVDKAAAAREIEDIMKQHGTRNGGVSFTRG